MRDLTNTMRKFCSARCRVNNKVSCQDWERLAADTNYWGDMDSWNRIGRINAVSLTGGAIWHLAACCFSAEEEERRTLAFCITVEAPVCTPTCISFLHVLRYHFSFTFFRLVFYLLLCNFRLGYCGAAQPINTGPQFTRSIFWPNKNQRIFLSRIGTGTVAPNPKSKLFDSHFYRNWWRHRFPVSSPDPPPARIVCVVGICAPRLCDYPTLKKKKKAL